MTKTLKPSSYGFTLVELLIVIAIIAVLALISFVGASRFMENGRKVQTMAQFRDFDVGMAMFIGDYQRPPAPQYKKTLGIDTIYGDPNGNYSNDYLVSVLAGEDKEYPYKGENFASKEANPRGEAYMTFPLAPDNKKGVGKDGKLYDPWGRQIMIAINALNGEGETLVSSNKGNNDRLLWTYGLAEYTDTKPKEQNYVLWSYGKDGKKGKAGANPGAIVPFADSDDVISW